MDKANGSPPSLSLTSAGQSSKNGPISREDIFGEVGQLRDINESEGLVELLGGVADVLVGSVEGMDGRTAYVKRSLARAELLGEAAVQLGRLGRLRPVWAADVRLTKREAAALRWLIDRL